MQYTAKDNTSQAIEPGFAARVIARSGANLGRCYQCLTCTLGCPVAPDMDYPPNQIVRMVQLGLKDAVLGSATIWLCAACETCVTRCPNEVDIVAMMDTLRQMALEEKVKCKETAIANFHQLFLDSIREHGHQYELGLLMRLKLKNRDLFSDIGLGMKMLSKGKLKILPPKSHHKQAVKDIFARAKKLEEGEA